MTTRVYLLRHGATAANREVPYRLQGRGSDRPLDEIGRLQASAAARALEQAPIVAVYSSPLARALQTAEPLAHSRGLIVQSVAAWIEGDCGRWEGLTWDEAAALDPETFHRFMDDPGTTPYPDGESFLDVQDRVTPALARLAAEHRGESIAVVGHNIANRAYLAGPLGLAIAKARGIRLSNGGISVVEFGPDGRSTVLTLNAALHLDGLDLPHRGPSPGGGLAPPPERHQGADADHQERHRRLTREFRQEDGEGHVGPRAE